MPNMRSSRRVAPGFLVYLRFALVAGVLIFLTSAMCYADASDTIVVQWNNAALQGVRDSRIGPPMVARAHGTSARTLGTIWPVRLASRQPHGRSGCQNVLCAG
jgi:hypothetical protein